MCIIKDAWERQRLEYQSRYAGVCERYRGMDENMAGRECRGRMLEMSYVLVTVFGLTSRQVDEVEKNGGFTDKDIDDDQPLPCGSIRKGV